MDHTEWEAANMNRESVMAPDYMRDSLKRLSNEELWQVWRSLPRMNMISLDLPDACLDTLIKSELHRDTIIRHELHARGLMDEVIGEDSVGVWEAGTTPRKMKVVPLSDTCWMSGELRKVM